MESNLVSNHTSDIQNQMTAKREFDLLIMTRLLNDKYFKEPRGAKAKKFGAQQVMFWELLQNFRCP